MSDSLGDRMKEYEAVPQLHLIRRMPAILRLDGRAFHTLTRSMQKPFDEKFSKTMELTAISLFYEVQTAVLAYIQSDEISILLKDYTKLETQSWFGGNIQKIVSISAGLCSTAFNHWLTDGEHMGSSVFDARVFNLPKEDVVNYFIWRQKDATRNSINSVGQANFSHKELHGKSQTDVLDMLHAKGINWNTLPTKHKRGICISKGPGWERHGAGAEFTINPDLEIPIFTENREYISRYLESEV